MKRLIKYILAPFEAFGFLSAYIFFRTLPLRAGQKVGFGLGQIIGRFHPSSAIIHKNLDLSQTTTPDSDKFAQDVWGNFGALAAEYAHTHAYAKIIKTKLQVEGDQHLNDFLNSPNAGLCVSAHIGNWALGTAYIYTKASRRLAMIHRPPNNSFVNAMFHHIQKPFSDVIVEKNPLAGQRLLRLLNQNTDIAMLIDQKNNTGISSPFLERPAMTTTGPALLTLKHNRPILPFMCVRNPDGTFILKFSAVLWPKDFKSEAKPVQALTNKLNQICSDWIHETGSQWFWLHKRYPRGLYKIKR